MGMVWGTDAIRKAQYSLTDHIELSVSTLKN